MTASLGVARGPGCAGDRYLFLFVCASVLARAAAVLREGCEEPRAAGAPVHARALSHCRGPGLRCGALNPLEPLLILISAAAASFGGNSGLAWMWNLLYGPRIPSSEFQMPEIERSRGWIIATVVLAIGFIMGLGPGVKFHPV
jgi:hypothetical protein